MQDLVTGYLAHLATEQVTKSTHKTYRQRLRQFTTWLDAEGKTFDRASVIGYVDACQQHHKPRTIRPAMAAIRDLAAWMVATGREAPDLAGVKGPSLNPPNRYTPTNEEMQAFWTAAKTLPGFTFPERFARGRATVLLCLAACTAIRRFELLAIQVADVQLEDEAPVLRIRRGKGAKYREIAINAEAQG
ncbi:MAG TPA: site-specific integrase, partial [Armatimonadota bacterium]|nr:site-specific integrase [Armatimonadota bacterium]